MKEKMGSLPVTAAALVCALLGLSLRAAPAPATSVNESVDIYPLGVVLRALNDRMEELYAADAGIDIREVQILFSRGLAVLELENGVDHAAVNVGDRNVVAFRMAERDAGQLAARNINAVACAVERARRFALLDVNDLIRTTSFWSMKTACMALTGSPRSRAAARMRSSCASWPR